MNKKEKISLEQNENYEPVSEGEKNISIPEELKQESKREPIENLIVREENLYESSKGILRRIAEKFEGSALNKGLFLSALLYCNVFSSSLAKEAAAYGSKEKETKISESAKMTDRRAEIKKQIESLEKHIGLCKHLGYSVKIDKEINAKLLGEEEFKMLEKRIENKTEENKEENEKEDSSEKEDILSLNKHLENPLSWMENLIRLGVTHLPRELNDTFNTVSINPLSVESKIIKEGEREITLYNWFKPNAPIVYSKRINKNELKRSGWDIQLKKIIEKELEDINKYQETVNKIPASEYKDKNLPLIDLDKEKILGSAEKQDIENLTEKIDAIKIKILPEGFNNVDTEISAELPKEKLKELKHPIKINGALSKIVISEKKRQIIKEDDKTINGEDKVKIYKDEYGNLIEEIIFHEIIDETDENGVQYKKLSENEAHKEIQIMPPMEFDREKNNPEEKVSLNIGLKDAQTNIRGVFLKNAEKPFVFTGEKGQRAFYTNSKDKNNIAKFGEKVPFVDSGIERAEKLFGVADKNPIKNIYILDTINKNAYFHPKDPDTIGIHDEMLKEKDDDYLSKVAFHETIHQIDDKYKISNDEEFRKIFIEARQNYIIYKEKSTKIQKLFGVIPIRKIITIKGKPENMHTLIAEEHFLPKMKEAGHPWDNTNEFFASFMNTFNHPEWKQGMKESGLMEDENIMNLYIKTLETLKNKLRNIKEIPENAPVFNEIDEKLSYLR